MPHITHCTASLAFYGNFSCIVLNKYSFYVKGVVTSKHNWICHSIEPHQYLYELRTKSNFPQLFLRSRNTQFTLLLNSESNWWGKFFKGGTLLLWLKLFRTLKLKLTATTRTKKKLRRITHSPKSIVGWVRACAFLCNRKKMSDFVELINGVLMFASLRSESRKHWKRDQEKNTLFSLRRCSLFIHCDVSVWILSISSSFPLMRFIIWRVNRKALSVTASSSAAATVRTLRSTRCDQPSRSLFHQHSISFTLPACFSRALLFPLEARCAVLFTSQYIKHGHIVINTPSCIVK